jgi:hypothetical protein
MATILEFDRRYATRQQAAAGIPSVGGWIWKVIHRGGEDYRLQLTTDNAVGVMKTIKRHYPLHTFKVIACDEDAPRQTK